MANKFGNDNLIKEDQENIDLIRYNDKCDKYDYLIATGCGAIGGLIDIFLVGTPGNSKLQTWTDNQVDKCVMSFAKKLGWNGNEKGKGIDSAIGFLEKKFGVNYDQRHTQDVNGAFNMSAKNHHMKSLGHSPDIIGLFFSVINQFAGTSSFIADGKIITIDVETQELRGGNFIAKLFCGIANWFGHIMSDIAGAQGSRGNGNRGTGIVMPFYELFGLCKFGKFSAGKDKQDLATIATRAFQSGYDARFGLTMAIPVVITDLLIKLIWALRKHFQYGAPIKECIPSSKYAELRVMLLVGNGVLCVMDGIDAAIRSGGDFLQFFMHLNLVGWIRFIQLVLKEILIRLGIVGDLEKTVEAYKRVNAALVQYMAELEKIDIELFKRETTLISQTTALLDNCTTHQQLNERLIEIYDKIDIDIPWKGYDSFDSFMKDDNAVLVFE